MTRATQAIPASSLRAGKAHRKRIGFPAYTAYTGYTGYTGYKAARKLIGLLLLLSASPFALAAHDPAPPSGDARDFVTNRHAGLALTAKLVPAAVLASADENEEGGDAARSRYQAAFAYAAAHAKNEDLGATVGQVAYLVLRLERGGVPVSGTVFDLSFDHIEDDKEVFATSSGRSIDGTWIWGQQFFDGAEHRVHISATAPNGESLATEMTVAVQGISPPAGSIVRSMAILLFVVAVGMVAGYWFGVRAGGGRNL